MKPVTRPSIYPICAGPPALAAGTWVIWSDDLGDALGEWQPASRRMPTARRIFARRLLDLEGKREKIIGFRMYTVVRAQQTRMTRGSNFHNESIAARERRHKVCGLSGLL